MRFLNTQGDFWKRKKEKIPSLTLQAILKRIDTLSITKSIPKHEVEKIFKEELSLDFDLRVRNLFDSEKIKCFSKKSLEQIVNFLSARKNPHIAAKDFKPDSFELSDEERRALEIQSLQSHILKTCQDMIDFICTGFVRKRANNSKISVPFRERYKRTKDWQLLISNVLEYKTKKDYSSISQYFLAGIGTAIYNDIKADINSIEEIVKSIDIHNNKTDECHYDEFNYSDFSYVDKNDTLAQIIPKSDLEIIRSPIVNLPNMIAEYIGHIAIAIKANIDKVRHTVDKNAQKMDSVIKGSCNLDDDLTQLGM